jgi:hypothetical protein
MSFHKFGLRWSLLVLPVLLLLMAGCPFSPEKDPKPPVDPVDPDYVANTSITNVLANLKTVYNKHNNIEQYKALLDESYQYIFDPQDVGTNGIPEAWGKADDVVSAEHLFRSDPNADGYKMEQISLNFLPGSDVVSEVEPAWRKVTLTQITLLVDTRHKDNGDPLRYEVIGDQADIHFLQTNDTDPTSGARIWKIVYWVDKPIGALVAAKN